MLLSTVWKYSTEWVQYSNDPVARDTLNSKKAWWLRWPTQLTVQGQWWSILREHLLHWLQWPVLRGLKASAHLLHFSALRIGLRQYMVLLEALVEEGCTWWLVVDLAGLDQTGWQRFFRLSP